MPIKKLQKIEHHTSCTCHNSIHQEHHGFYDCTNSNHIRCYGDDSRATNNNT